jgi:hypothetical protein
MAAAKQVRRLNWATDDTQVSGGESELGSEAGKDELTNELERTRAELAERDTALTRAKQWIKYLAERGAELEQRGARESPTPQIPKEHVEAALDVQSAATDKRIAELEGELDSARQGLVLRECENRSLQASLNLIVNENSRLSRRLAESEASVEELNEKRRIETNTLNTRLTAMSLRAVAAEKLLAETPQGLLGRIDEKRVAERWTVDSTGAHREVDRKFDQVPRPLSIKFPAERAALLEAEAELVEVRRKIKELDFRLQCERKERALAEHTRERSRTNCVELHCKLGNDAKQFGVHSEQEVHYTQALLANILAS